MDNDNIAFSRTSSKTSASDTVELRVDIPVELARRIDALLMVNRLKSRADYVVPELTRAVEEEFHRATVLLRCAGINPLISSMSGKGAE